MAVKILGVDIGGYSIKAALFESSFKQYRITDLFESRPLHIEELSKEEAHAATAEALHRFVESNALEADIVVASLSDLKVSHRLINLPLKDRRQIEKALPFELEGYLPFDLSELMIDHELVESEPNGSTILALAVKEDFVADYVRLFDDNPLDPQIIDLDVLALGNVSHISNIPNDEACVLINIGHTKTSMCLIQNRRAIAVRTLFTGGKAITDSLRVDLDLTFQQAEEVKHKHGQLLLADGKRPNPKAAKIAKSIKKVVDKLIVDFNQTIHNFESIATETKRISHIFLCGGSSLIKNIDAYLGAGLQRDVGMISCHQGDDQLYEKIGKKEAVMIQAISLGLRNGIRGVSPAKLSQVNFRKGPFATTRERGELRRNLSHVGKWAAVLLILFVMNVSIRYLSLSAKVNRLERDMITDLQKAIPDLPKKRVRSSKQALGILKSRIEEYRKKVDVLTLGLHNITALHLLREISSRLPKDIAIDVREISIDRNKVFIRGDADSFTSVDKIVSLLEEYDEFSKVTKGAVSDAPESNKKRFTLSIVVGKDQEGEVS